MKMTNPGRIIVLLMLYIAVFVALVAVQFPQTGGNVVSKGSVTLKLRGKAGSGELNSVELLVPGIRFLFSASSPLRYRTGTGENVEAVPVRYRESGDGFVVYFDHDVQLSVYGTKNGGAVLTIKAPEPLAQCALPYKYARGVKTSSEKDSGSLRLRQDTRVWLIEDVLVAQEPGLLSPRVARGSVKPIRINPVDTSKPESSVQYLAQTPVDAAVWAKEISDWQDKAWMGLSSSRLVAGSLRWRQSGGTPAFSESAYLAYMAEALRRNKREAAASAVSVARADYADQLSWKASPFAGRTASTMRAREEADFAEVKAIEKLVQSKSPELFYRYDIIPFLFDRSPYSLAQEAMVLARTVDFNQADLLQSIQIVENYLASRDYLGEAENPFSRASELIDKTIASAIRKTDSGFFLQSDADGTADSLLGLRVGMLLVRMADATGKSIYAGIGQSLVTSLLRLSDESGSLPQSVNVKSGMAESAAERIMAEAAYPLVARSPYYPHAVSFYRDLGPGAWAWTCSPSLRLSKTASATVFSADFPVDSSHYLTLYGIKPYVSIQLYNINYNMDAEFEIYNASGYFYKRASSVLYVKMKHKAQAEDIRLNY